MKLTQEQYAEVEAIKCRANDDNIIYTVAQMDEDINYMADMILNSRPESGERFTYEMRDCLNCDGSGNVSAAMSSIDCDVENCPACGGLGKVRVKVKSKAHNA